MIRWPKPMFTWLTGRDAQAEEILLDALKNDPKSRIAIYLQLLEIYAQRRSLKQFENIATDLFTQTGGAGDDWAKAAAWAHAWIRVIRCMAVAIRRSSFRRKLLRPHTPLHQS